MVAAGFCTGMTSSPETAESAAALSPVPALFLHSGCQKHPIAAGCSLSFPKSWALLGGQGGSGMDGELGHLGELFAAI